MDEPSFHRHTLKRRDFLGGLGATGAMLVSHADPSVPEMNDTQQRLRSLLSGSAPAIWLFTGDSITHGAIHTMGWRSYPELVAERVRWELRRTRDVVINTGIAGDRTAGLLKDLNWRILQFKPQVTSIMMGMNDCAAGPAGREGFRGNLNKLVDALEAHNSVPILNTTNPMYPLGPDSQRRKDLPAYNDIIREVAHERKTVLVDRYSHWLMVKKHEGELLYWLSDGAFHPNEYGHREMANLIFKELGI
jgi:acyl-CoA thioesterase-1